MKESTILGRGIAISGLLLASMAFAHPAWAVPPNAADDHGIDLQAGALRIKVTALLDNILRVRIAPTGVLTENASWVVPAEMRDKAIEVQGWTDSGAVGFRTATLSVRLEREPLRLIVSDLEGQVISADAVERSVESVGAAFTLRKNLAETEHFFGMGDKTGPMDRRGQRFIDWNTDAYQFQESSDPLYKSVPFFIGTGGPGGSYGIYLDNTWRSWFDFGKQEPDVLAFGSAAGPIDYYLIYGPSLKEVVERFTDLSGKAPLAPLWSLGYQQSRYSYLSAREVRRVAASLRAEHIPADALWLDIDYQDRNRPFTTNPITFADFPSLARDLRSQGLRLVAITDLHIAAVPDEHYVPYDSGAAGDQFVKRSDGTVYVADVWPGRSVFPEFTDSRTRDWWGSLYTEFLAAGVSGFWNDMNEPATFYTANKTMPADVVHRIEEPGFAQRLASHAEIHNIYGMENSRATFDGMRRLAPDERPYVMTRASFAGGQRYAVTWTGDNSSSWNHLKLSISMLLNLGMSGFGYSGADVGGFAGAPSPELLTRWIEIAAFTPVFRNHSVKGSIRREPWLNGPQHTAIRRRFIEERYRLLPYIYGLADENARTGAPIMRPVFYEFPEALRAGCDQSTTFLLGSRLLIAPQPEFESRTDYDICLPSGRWYDYWTGIEVGPERGGALKETPSLARLPVFVRAGAILPRQPLVQSTDETPLGPLALDIYPGDGCRGVLYADDGHSLAYTRDGFLRQTLRCSQSAEGLAIDFDKREGTFKPWWHQIEVTVHGWRGDASATLNGTPIRIVRNATAPATATLTVTMRLSDQPEAARLLVRHAHRH